MVVFLCFFFFFKQKTAYEIRLSLVGSEMCIRDRYSWYQHVVLIEPFLSPAIVLHVGAYPLLAVGLLVLVRSRGSAPAPAALRRAVGMRRSGARWRARGTARAGTSAGTR